MRFGRVRLCLLMPLLMGAGNSTERGDFLTPDERAWIRNHPVISFAAETDWRPMEYVEDGTFKGLASEYLKAISKSTGLVFQMEENTAWGERSAAELLERKVDIMPAISSALAKPVIRKNLIFSSPYFVGTMIVVARDDAPIIFDARELDGKLIAMKGGGAHEYALKQRHPKIHIISYKRIEDALEAAAQGQVDAVVGLDAVVLPALRNTHYGRLQVSGALSEMKIELSMGVRKDMPELASIINKCLARLTAKQASAMVAQWLDGTGYGQPSDTAVIWYYRYEFGTLIAGLLLIGAFTLRARRAKLLAVQSEETKSRFLAVMSHEIRTPMNGILASVELLNRTRLDHEQRDLIESAISASQTLLSLLDDILDLSKIDANRLVLEHIPTNIELSIRSALKMAELLAVKKELPLLIHIDCPDNIDALTDPIRIRQILYNLVSNAIKFTKTGSVTVQAKLEIGSVATLTITVQDTGIGIPADIQSTLFQPFVQAESGTSRQFGGTGLGLTICRELVCRMGGTIGLVSAPGVGTTVKVSIPMQTQQRKQPEINEPPDIYREPSQTERNRPAILVVEDHPVNLRLFSKQLIELGYQPTLVENGARALHTIQRQHYAAVLLDCDLPDMTGYDVARNIRAEGNSDVAIIAVSAATGALHREKCIDSGMDGVLAKPIRLSELRNILEAWIVHSDMERPPNNDLDIQTTDRIYELFFETALKDIEKLRNALDSDNRNQAKHFAHRIKGSADTLEYSEIGNAAGNVETAITREATCEEVHTLVNNLQALVAQFALGRTSTNHE